jgi:uncharacterized protein YwgA
MNPKFLLRIKDVSLCLFVALQNNFFLGRLDIQKIIYIIDNISAYIFVLSGNNKHHTYYYGPYDKYIQNALNALVIREFVEITNVNVSKSGIKCDYCLTDAGIDWTNSLTDKSDSIKYRNNIVESVFHSLVQRNLIHKVKNLVYAEPVYVTKRNDGHYYDLNLKTANPGHEYLSLIEHYVRSDGKHSNINFVTDLYIDYLFSRDKILSGKSFDEGD